MFFGKENIIKCIKKGKMMVRKLVKKLSACVLAAAVVAGLTGCGSVTSGKRIVRISHAQSETCLLYTSPLREIQPDGSRHPFDQFIVSKTPAGRWGDAEDLGGPAVFLASDASNFVNGLVLYVDGGILAYIGKQPK